MSETDICPHCGGYVEEDDNENHLIYLKNFLEKERKYQINPNVFSKQTEINTNTFKVLMDWIFLLYKFTTFPPEACALGAEYENTLVLICVPSMIESDIVY